MKKLLLLLLLCTINLSVFAWGATGHRATGQVAEKYLSKNAKKELDRILNGQSLAMASTWMDEIRSDSTYDYTADWHWVTIQNGETYDQSTKNPKGDVIQTLERIIAELKSKKLNAKQEAEYVKMLIHLIGDLHQPLHVGGGNDRGGNDVKVMWFRVDSNLHRIWDSDMIDDSKLSYTELAQSLDKPTSAQLQQWQKISVRDWAAESMTYRKQVYDYGQGKLGYNYTYKYFPIVRERLLQAGVRIASVLNDIYGK
ncbi:MAG TPA: S1/P1 nuclease [Ohtaekwangia sp.]